MSTGKLYLIPNVIAEKTSAEVIPASIRERLKSIHHFLAEDIRTARRYLSSLKIYDSIEFLDFKVLNKDTQPEELKILFGPLLEGKNLGVISESGCPGVADPGALAVMYAHEVGITVVPCVGPSSLLLALMASGLNGQCFAFQGYLPVDEISSGKAIRDFEKESKAKNQTQIFIETPYRNNAIFSNLLKNLRSETLLCVAIDLTGEKEYIRTKRVKSWKGEPKEWPKLPSVFLFLA